MNQPAGDGHDPLSVLNHAGDGIRTMIICSCGQMKANPAARMSTMNNGHMAHRRRLGLPRADYTRTRFGEGPWKGLTWDEWYAKHGTEGVDPYTGRKPRVIS